MWWPWWQNVYCAKNKLNLQTWSQLIECMHALNSFWVINKTHYAFPLLVQLLHPNSHVPSIMYFSFTFCKNSASIHLNIALCVLSVYFILPFCGFNSIIVLKTRCFWQKDRLCMKEDSLSINEDNAAQKYTEIYQTKTKIFCNLIVGLTCIPRFLMEARCSYHLLLQKYQTTCSRQS